MTDDISMQGRYAAVLSQGQDKSFFLYDCASFVYDDMEITIPQRPALEVRRTDIIDGEHVIILEGNWDGVGAEGQTFEQPVQASLMIGDGQRVFPIRQISTDGNQTIVYCTRDPGFTYDAKTGLLEDTFSPWVTYEGQANLSLPSKTIIRHDGGNVHGTGTGVFTLNGEAFASR